MKKLLISTALIILSAFSVFGQTCEWAEGIGGKDHEEAYYVALDNYGNIYVASRFYSDTLFFNNGKVLINSGNADPYLAKYNSSGTCLWAENIKGELTDFANCMAVDESGNVYLAGQIKSSIINFNNGISITKINNLAGYLAKYNTSGICLWAEQIVGINNDQISIRGISEDVFENIYIVGEFHAQILSFNNGITLDKSDDYDAFIAKYNSSGICQWAQKITGTNSDYASSITVDNKCDIYVAGNYLSKSLNFNNGKSITNNGLSDAFITKYNSSGVCLWVEKISGNSNEIATSTAIDFLGNIYLTGYFESVTLSFNNNISKSNYGKRNGYIAKFDSLGNCQWAEIIGGSSYDLLNCISIDTTGNAYVSGYFSSSLLSFNNGISLKNSGANDGYIAKFDSTGNCNWSMKIAGINEDFARGIAIFDEKYFYVVGGFAPDIISFNNNKSLTNIGSMDGYIAKYNMNTVSVSEKPIQNNILVYPNPATDYIMIQPSEGFDIQIFDMLGVIQSTPDCFAATSASGGQRIDVSFLSPGIYFIKIGNRLEKFVKI